MIYAAREGFGAACRVLVQYQAGHGHDRAVVKTSGWKMLATPWRGGRE